MKSKVEVIKEAYGDYYEICNPCENGWSVKRKGIGFEQLKKIIELEYNQPHNAYAFRPKSLQGIETNNGWISINSEKDLPKVKDEQIVFFKDGITTTYLSDDVAEDKKFFTRYSHYKIKEKQINPIFK